MTATETQTATVFKIHWRYDVKNKVFTEEERPALGSLAPQDNNASNRRGQDSTDLPLGPKKPVDRVLIDPGEYSATLVKIGELRFYRPPRSDWRPRWQLPFHFIVASGEELVRFVEVGPRGPTKPTEIHPKSDLAFFVRRAGAKSIGQLVDLQFIVTVETRTDETGSEYSYPAKMRVPTMADRIAFTLPEAQFQTAPREK